MRRVWQCTVEPVFGSLLHHYGLRRVGTKGRVAAHKPMLISAITYNLKKLLKHHSKQVAGVAIALYPEQLGRAHHLISTWLFDFELLQVSFSNACIATLSSATATVVCST